MMASPPSISIPFLSLLLIIAVCIVPRMTAFDPLFRYDNATLELASQDYGLIVRDRPDSVFEPKYVRDIQFLIRQKYNRHDKNLSLRAHAHSTRGQCQVLGGIVINMTSIKNTSRINIGHNNIGYYADVGGELLWLDILKATLKRNLAPVSWTDYLHASVGGTLSNGGISGQSFKHGPQISNVYSLNAITGKGEMKTCTPTSNSDLFNAVLGGLGQFAVITQARIRLDKAPTGATVTRLMYSDFQRFSDDQEFLISSDLPNYVEGFVIVNNIIPSGWITSNSSVTLRDIDALLKNYTVLYAIEFAMYYDNQTSDTVHQKFQMLVGKLTFIPNFSFTVEMSYFDFLYRVGDLDTIQQQYPQAHPWLVLFIPGSQKNDFNKYVLAGLLPQLGQAPTIPLFYPLNATKWSNKTSAVIPDEEIFYTLGLLHRSAVSHYKKFDRFNQKLLSICRKNGIICKKYLPYYDNQGHVGIPSQKDLRGHLMNNWLDVQNTLTWRKHGPNDKAKAKKCEEKPRSDNKRLSNGDSRAEDRCKVRYKYGQYTPLEKLQGRFLRFLKNEGMLASFHDELLSQ
ncbi:cytokinin oxidase/dehydrogenase [Striga asiatica]|uniref:cytokinin dehydrogenase n=1 Tax=Striga asiatica TaxID=4170 RepID=A0A5A7NXE9_STRAF|nr:cytokinin oxidase/dehydrogenase [Striga asiatica]